MKSHLLFTLFTISLLSVGSIGYSYAANSVDVEEERTIALIGSAVDPDNDDLTYFWEQTGGEPVQLSAVDIMEPYFLAPSVNNGETKSLNFQLTVSDPFGGISQESVEIIVHPVNHAPTVDAGKDTIIFPSVNAITLFANGHDADGDVLTYSWNQIGGQTIVVEDVNSKHFTIDGTQLDFDNLTPLTFEVTVDDGFGGTDSDTVEVFMSIFSTENPSLAVDAGPIQTVNEGTLVTLHAEGWEINNKPISYSWAQHLGPVVNLSSVVSTDPTFIAPSIDDETPIVLSFVLTGYAQGSGYAQVTAIVKVLPVNNPPIADAGPDQTVREFSQVKLVGSGSDPDGDTITYSWSQTSGPEMMYNQFLH